MDWLRTAALCFVAIAWSAPTAGQDSNIPRPAAELERELGSAPFEIAAAEISRPKAQGDITLKAEVSFSGNPPYTVKLRRADPGADGFNNHPRYELAAYELQKLFLDPAEYVVPPTALRWVPIAGLEKYPIGVKPTFRGSDEVMVVLQYWLQDVLVLADTYNAELFASDPGYARHAGQLNVLTFLIEHGDANPGNFLVSKNQAGRRIFSVDHGVAFADNESDRSDVWKRMRVGSLPADTVERLRQVTPEELTARLAVLAQWRLQDGRWVAEPPGENLAPKQGARRSGDVLQLGLRTVEIDRLDKQRKELLKLVDGGKLGLQQGPAP